MHKPKIKHAASQQIVFSADGWREEGYIEALDDVISTLEGWDEEEEPLQAQGLIDALETLKKRKQQ